MKLRTNQYTLSFNDQLPDDINDPEELIERITKKITINSKASNLNSVFPWVRLAEDTLERYSYLEGKSILNLRYHLGYVLFVMGNYNKSKIMIEKVIETYLEMDKVNNKVLSVLYFDYARILVALSEYESADSVMYDIYKLTKDSVIIISLWALIETHLKFFDLAEYHFKSAKKFIKKEV